MRPKLLWSVVAVIALWLVTGVVGVAAVLKRLPELEKTQLIAMLRESRRLPLTPSDISLIERAMQVHVHSAFAVLPLVVLVRYEVSVGDRATPTATRAILWFGSGSCFLGSGKRGDRA